MAETAPQTASPRTSAALMAGTYVAGTAGIAVGFATVSADPPSLSVATLLAVGVAGGLSFLRHSVFHRSDAVRMGWDLGVRNNFQIEVGLANLAWAVTGVLAVALGWGIRAQAATLLTFGCYLLGVTAMQLFFPGGPRRATAAMVALGLFGLMLTVLGIWGMQSHGA